MRLSRSHTVIPAIFLLLLLIYLVCACQANDSLVPTATIVLETTASALQVTPTFAITSPTVLPPSRTTMPAPTQPATLNHGYAGSAYRWWTVAAVPAGSVIPGRRLSEELFMSNQDGSGNRILNKSDCGTARLSQL